ncbi:MAG: AAA family ATPase [Planctomycetes bacterium]|nr:AAA family ATPase [Planctomycetota bacterium]
MRIRAIHIDGFGIFEGLDIRDLDPRLVLFHGPNEAGKTTLCAFIEAILFGFPARRDGRRLEPLRGGRHGGLLEIQTAGGDSLRIARRAGRRQAGEIEVAGTGGPHESSVLDDLLGPVDRGLYRTIFAFGIEELMRLDGLASDKVADRIYAAGAGAPGADLTGADEDLERMAKDLFAPRAARARVPALLAELEGIARRIAERRRDPERYASLLADRERAARTADAATLRAAALRALAPFRRIRALRTRTASPGADPHAPSILPAWLPHACGVATLAIALAVWLIADARMAAGLAAIGLGATAILAILESRATRRRAASAGIAQDADRAIASEESAVRALEPADAAAAEAFRAALADLDRTLTPDADAPSLIRDAEREARNARERVGALAAEIGEIESSERLAELRAEQEALRAKLAGAVREYETAAAARTLLAAARRAFEREESPAVLRRASEYLAEMTRGRYARVFATSGERAFRVEPASGLPLAPGALSRGAADQLFLAIRLALAAEWAARGEPLPILLDDVLVNFDPERARGAVRAILRVAESTQILAFTCHPHIEDLFRAERPDLDARLLAAAGTAQIE